MCQRLVQLLSSVDLHKCLVMLDEANFKRLDGGLHYVEARHLGEIICQEVEMVCNNKLCFVVKLFLLKNVPAYLAHPALL